MVARKDFFEMGFDSSFEEMASSFFGVPSRTTKTVEGGTQILMDMPGVRPEDVEVTAEHGVLTISGKRSDRQDVVYEQKYRMNDSNPEGITAKLNLGVLMVFVPLSTTTGSPKIKVEVG